MPVESNRAQVNANVVRSGNVVQVFEERFHTKSVIWWAADSTLVNADGSFGCLVRVTGASADSDRATLVDDLEERFEALGDC